MKPSLPTKIALTIWMMTACATLAAVLLAGVLLFRTHRESIRSQLEAATTSLISLGISDFEALDDFEPLNLFIEEALQMEKVDKIVRIYNQEGQLVFTTVGLDYDQLPDHLEPIVTKPLFETLEGRLRRYEGLVLPYLGKGKNRPYYLQVVMPLPPYSEILASLWWRSLILLGGLMALSLIVSRRLSRHLLKPVVSISDYLQSMDPDHLEERQPLKMDAAGLYLEGITRGINTLLGKIQATVHQIRKMSRYVAHELRTPLTILQGEAETILAQKGAAREDYARVVQSSLEEIQRMSGIITTVLQIGETESPAFHPSVLDLGPWLSRHQDNWEKTLGRPLGLEIGEEGPFEVFADPKLLYPLIDNLIRNVRYHTPQETRCTLALSKKEKTVYLKISDAGPGLPASFMEALNRGEADSSLIGIGLNLCLRISKISGIKLVFHHQEGLTVRFEFR